MEMDWERLVVLEGIQVAFLKEGMALRAFYWEVQEGEAEVENRLIVHGLLKVEDQVVEFMVQHMVF